MVICIRWPRRMRVYAPCVCAFFFAYLLLSTHTTSRLHVPKFTDNAVTDTALPAYTPRATSVVQELAAEKVEAKGSRLRTAPSAPASCDELPCRSLMRPIDRDRYETCIRSSLERLRDRGFKHTKQGELSHSRCRLLTNTSRLPVFLASAPGSGNTWLRALLENVTELCTGSVYCDEELRAQHFEAEGIESGSVLVVKTHEPTPLWSYGPSSIKNVTLFGSGVLLVRNPLKSLVAHRKWDLCKGMNLSAHTAEIEITQDLRWTEFIYENMKRWVAMFRYVITSNPEHPVLIVSYEELVQNTGAQLRRVLSFLGVRYDAEELDRRLMKNLATFQRQHSNSTRLPFTAWQLEAVKKHVRLTVQLLDKYPHAQTVVRKYYSNEWM